MRVFFALWPPAQVSAALSACAATLCARHGGRATRAETIHLTLAFLGEVADPRLPGLLAAARTVVARRFTLQIDRIGYWRQQRLLWAGARTPPPALDELAGQLRGALRTAGFAECGSEAAAAVSRSFVPHLTLVRKLALDDPPAEAMRPIAWDCASFALVESRLSADGARYHRLAEFGATSVTSDRPAPESSRA